MNIYDIAKQAGVSVTTVSRVLNNNENVKNHFKYLKTFSMETGVDFKLYERVSKADEKESKYYVDTFNQWYSKYPNLYENRIEKYINKE